MCCEIGERGTQPRRHVIHFAFSLDRTQQATLAVKLDQRLGLLLIHLQALRDGLFLVIGTLQ